MNTKRHLLRVTLLFVVLMLSSSIQVMAQKYNQNREVEKAVENNEDFRKGAELAFRETS